MAKEGLPDIIDLNEWFIANKNGSNFTCMHGMTALTSCALVCVWVKFGCLDMLRTIPVGWVVGVMNGCTEDVTVTFSGRQVRCLLKTCILV